MRVYQQRSLPTNVCLMWVKNICAKPFFILKRDDCISGANQRENEEIYQGEAKSFTRPINNPKLFWKEISLCPKIDINLTTTCPGHDIPQDRPSEYLGGCSTPR